MDAGNSGRIRHVDRGAETSSRGWRLEGRGEVDNVPRRERMLGAGDIKRAVKQSECL